MSEVAIYTRPNCPYCSHAKALLDSRQIAYKELDVTKDPDLLTEMLRRTGGRTFPQIVIGERSVGGYDDLRALDGEGRLRALLEPQRTAS
ncbi:MAG: glutaredoxin 3 [Candidatus Thiodiazotropha sp.]